MNWQTERIFEATKERLCATASFSDEQKLDLCDVIEGLKLALEKESAIVSIK